MRWTGGWPECRYTCDGGHEFVLDGDTHENALAIHYKATVATPVGNFAAPINFYVAHCPVCGRINMEDPFAVGDLVEYPNIVDYPNHVGAMFKERQRGRVTRVTWSNDEGFTWHVWVRFDDRREDHEFKFAHGAYEIRKLDPVEALGKLGKPKSEGG